MTPEPKHRSEQKAAVLVRAPDNVRHLAGDSISANSAASRADVVGPAG